MDTEDQDFDDEAVADDDEQEDKADKYENDKNDDEDDDRVDDDTVVVELSDPQYRNTFVRGRITGPRAPRIRRRVRRPSIRRSRGRPCRSGLLAYRCTRLG